MPRVFLAIYQKGAVNHEKTLACVRRRCRDRMRRRWRWRRRRNGRQRGRTAGTTGAGGTGACVTGDEGCACYGNGTCNGSLQCFSSFACR